MKKLSILFTAALAALTVFSCAKEENVKDIVPEGPTISFTAIAEGTDVKTVVDASENWANWSASDQLKIIEYANGAKNAEGSTDIASLSADQKTATFSASITGDFPDGKAASYVAAYPASRFSESTGANKNYRLMMPASQSPVVGSFDPSADLLISAPVSKSDNSRVSDSDELSFRFHRLGTAVKMTLSGLTNGEKLKEVTITAPVNIAGYVKPDMTNGGYASDANIPYASGSKTITLTIADWVISGDVDVWFRVLPGSWDSIEIVAKTDEATYYRTADKEPINLTSGAIEFVDGGRTTFAVNMGKYSEAAKQLADGNYLILAKVNENYFAMKAEGVSSDSRMASVDYSGDLSSYAGDADMVWTVTKSGSSYTIENDGKYLGYEGSDNKAFLKAADENWTTDNYLADILWDGTKNCYHVTNHKNSGRKLGRTASNNWFAFYTTDQQNDLIFVPATVTSKTPVLLSFSESAVNLTTATYTSFAGQPVIVDPNVTAITEHLSWSYTDPDGIIEQQDEDALILNGTPGTATVTVSFAGDDTYRSATASYTITVSTVITGPAYTKVTAAPADWSGEYLMVCESENKALSEISTTSTKYGIGADVTISSNAIASTATVDAYKVTIAKASEGDAYTLSFAGSYLNWGSGNSLSTNSAENDNSRWTISASATAGNWLITNVAQNTRVIWYNTGSPRFACYENKTETSSGYAAVQLYVLEDSRQDPGMSWSAASATATYATGNTLSFTAPTINPGNASGVTYASSDETIATIDAASGAVTITALTDNVVKEGSTVISANFAGDTNYKSQTVSYTLTVADGRDAVATPTFNPVAGEVAANTEVVFNCADSGVTFYYTTNGSKPTTASNQGSSVIIDVAKTVKVIAVKTGYKNSDVAEAAYTVQGVSPAPAGSGTWSDPYNAAKALEIIDALADNASTDASVYVAGTITDITEFSTSYHNATYIIQSGNASVTVFRGKNFNGTDFTDQASELAVNDAVIVYGKLKKFVNASGTTPEVDQNNYLFSRNGVIHLAKPAVTTTPDHANKKITVSWNTVDGATSYDVTCGTQSQNGITALTCEFTMPDYGTYDVQVTAKGGTGAVSAASDVKAVTLTDPSSGVTTGDEEYDTTSQGYTNQQAITSYEGTSFTVSFDKGTNSNAPKYYTSGTAIRCYGSNSFTVAGKSGYTLTKIELTFGSSDGSNAITTDCATYASGTWTGSASSVTFTIGGTTGNRRIRKITVYWQK